MLKVWTSKVDWDGGTYDKLYCPIDLGQLELAYDELSGTATYIFDGGARKKFNWQSFSHTKENTKTIWRDDFRENTLAKYYLEKMFDNASAYTAPTYDSANKRVSFDTGDNKNFSMRLKNVSIQNFILSYKFKGISIYPTNFAFLGMGRWVDNANMYMAVMNDTGAGINSALGKVVGGTFSDLTTGPVYHTVGTEGQLITTFNGNSLKVEIVGVGSISVNDGTFPNAGPVKIGAYQGIGWINDFLLEHYTLPSPPNTTVSFKFWPSNDGTTWGNEYTDITLVPNSRFIKVEVTMSRTTFLSSAMPVLKDMTLGYKLLVQPSFI